MISLQSKGLRVFFTSFILFTLEIILSHVLRYTTHYMASTTVLGYALLGVGVGGFAASRVRSDENSIFARCLLGTWLMLVLSVIKILKYPSMGIDNLVISGLFFFPGLYLSRAFTEQDAGRIYFLDLCGAGFASTAIFFLYQFSYSELILIFMLLGIAASGLFIKSRLRPVFGILTLTALALLVIQISSNSLNFFYQVKNQKPYTAGKMFGGNLKLVKFYDNLVSRIDVTQGAKAKKKNNFGVQYSGYPNDHFNDYFPKGYKNDIRIVTCLIEKPAIFLIGSAAQGIVKTARYYTDIPKIQGVEINPAIHRMMTNDFSKESNYAYKNLDMRIANAVSFLKHSDRKFDIITLMNCHSMPRISASGPPDYLHTRESYRMYFDRLEDRGYIMLEERPNDLRGEMGVYRIISTLYDVLKEMGAKNPENHFFVYGWRSGKKVIYERHAPAIYTGILIKKSELTDGDREALVKWTKGKGFPQPFDSAKPSKSRLLYLNGVFVDAPYDRLFKALAAGRVAEEYPEWDLSPITDNKPYSSQVDRTYHETKSLVRHCLLLSLPFLIFIGISAWRHSGSVGNVRFLIYQFLIGLGYILIEMLFMQVYQKELLSPSIAFAVMLPTLLISSGIGGRYLPGKIKPPITFALLSASILTHLILQNKVLEAVSSYGVKMILIIAAVGISGLFMGYFFPWGVELSKSRGLAKTTGHYFAFNCIAGMLGSALSFHLSVVHGFQFTAFMAMGVYFAGYLVIGCRKV